MDRGCWSKTKVSGLLFVAAPVVIVVVVVVVVVPDPPSCPSPHGNVFSIWISPGNALLLKKYVNKFVYAIGGCQLVPG